MGRAVPVDLPSKTFAKQGDAREFFKAMLHRYRDGERINEADSVLLAELLDRHPDDKVKIGIDHFFRRKSDNHPTSGFAVMRKDGVWTDFSYPDCISGKKPGPESYFYRACYSAVTGYLTEMKRNLFIQGPVVCSETGERVTSTTSELRHTELSFSDLLAGFKKENPMTIDSSLFAPDRDQQYIVTFKDPSIASRFIDYHRANARMAIFKKR